MIIIDAVRNGWGRLRLLERLETPHDGSRLPAWKLTSFAMPAVAMRAGLFPLMFFIPPMYSQEFGLGLASIGFVFAAIRITDAAWDPLIAIFLDKTNTRFGRRRPWVLGGTPIMLMAFMLLYMPGLFIGDQATPVYLFAAMMVLYMGTTLYGLSHSAWAAELSTDYHERSRIQAYEAFVGTAGGAAVMGIPIYFELFTDATLYAPRVEAMGWFAIFAIPLAVALAVITVPERRVSANPPINILKAFKILLSNPHLVRIAIIDTLHGMQGGVQVALAVFFFQYVIEAPEVATITYVVLNFGAMAGILVWTRMSKRVNKHKVVALANSISLVAYISMAFLGPGDIFLFACISVASGIGAAGSQFLLRSITVDIVDYDNWKSGQERTALFFAVLSTTARIGPSIAVGIALPLLAYLGFDPAVETPDEQGILALRGVFIIMPVILSAVAIFLTYNFKLDEEVQKGLRRMIEEREAGKAPEETEG